MYQITRARKDKDEGTIIHEIAGQPDLIYTDIRGGVSWPKETAPGYFCIVGERFNAGHMKKRPLVLLREYESTDLQEFFRVLTDTMIELGSQNFYADLRPENECFADAFYSFFWENLTAAKVYIGPAPWVESFEFGTILIRDYLKCKALEIDRDTIAASQLGSLTKAALLERPEVEFYAVNALRFVVGAFKKSPWNPPNDAELDALMENYIPLGNYSY